MNENMKCKETKDLLFDYLTERLEAEVCNDVELHLNACESCQIALEEMKKTFNLLDLAKPPTLGPEFTEQVMADKRIADPAKPVTFGEKCLRIFSAYHFKLIPAFTAILVIFIGVFVYFRFLAPQKPIIHREIEITLVKPIKIKSDNLPSTLSTVEATVHFFKGETVSKEVPPSGVRLTIKLPVEKESDFLETLKDLETLYIEGNYKNKEGNIVIFIEKK